jgi:RNAse (barnase) inhibitor barstar
VAAVTVVELDASDWETKSDFYDALLSALGSPDWHGRSPVALVDSMLHNDINKVAPPYRVEVRNSENLSPTVKAHIIKVMELFEEVRARRRVRGVPDANVTIVLS